MIANQDGIARLEVDVLWAAYHQGKYEWTSKEDPYLVMVGGIDANIIDNKIY